MWNAAEDDIQYAALVTATRAIDRLNYNGSKTSDTQVNQFPRDDDTVVPQDIIDATIEIAIELVEGKEPEKEFENLFTTKSKFDSVEVTFDRSVLPEHIVAGIMSITAWRLIKPYLRESNRLTLRRTS